MIVNTKSVEVTKGFKGPDILYPTTFGSTILIGCPSITASASIPPTPQPKTPRPKRRKWINYRFYLFFEYKIQKVLPLIIVVCESVPTTESGYTMLLLVKQTLAKYSRLTWWTIPDPEILNMSI